MYLIETVPLFEQSLNALKRSGKTLIGYRSDVNNLIHFLDREYNRPIQVTEVSVKDLWGFVEALEASGRSGRTINRILHGLRSYFDFLVARDMVASNPARMVPRISETKSERVFLTEEQLGILLNQSDDPVIRVCLYMLVYTGMRVSELCLAILSDLHPELKSITVHGKGNKERTIALHPVTCEVLADFLQTHRDTKDPYQRILCTHMTDSLSPSTVNRWLSTLCDELNWPFKVTAHTLRHSFGYLYVKRGGDVIELQKILGHDSLNTTTVYTHKTPEELEAGIRQLPNFLNGEYDSLCNER